MSGWGEDIVGADGVAAPPQEVAVHEAAHAVIAARVGLSPIWIEIDLANARGEMTLDTPWHPPTPRQRMLIAQAGSAAQHQLNGTTLGWTFEGTADRLIADDLAEEDPSSDPDDFTEITALLVEPGLWDRISRLAALLLSRRRIEIPELTEYL